MSLKNSNETIGNGTRDLPVCSVGQEINYNKSDNFDIINMSHSLYVLRNFDDTICGQTGTPSPLCVNFT
jgi:hypothetical protein